MKETTIRGISVYCIDVDASEELGFNFPFRIIIPKNISDSPNLVYACTLPRDRSSDYSTIEELIECAREDYGSLDPMLSHLCFDLGNPMIIPFIPRLRDFRPNFLGRDCFKNSFYLSEHDSIFGEQLFIYDNLAEQMKNMIEYAIKCLKKEGIEVDEKVIMSGYSEGAKCASHFSLLHPEIIKAIIAGGTGGAISMPIDHLDGYEFVYPTGISGLKKFDFESFKKIAFFYYMGDADRSDSAMPYFEDYHYIDENGNDCVLVDEGGNRTPYIDENGNQLFKLDENGNYTARYNLFSDSEVNAINKVLGTVTQKRFKRQEEVYNSLGLDAVFILYPGNHRTVFDHREMIFADVDSFINEKISKKTKK